MILLQAVYYRCLAAARPVGKILVHSIAKVRNTPMYVPSNRSAFGYSGDRL